jgi:hypothetical protein
MQEYMTASLRQRRDVVKERYSQSQSSCTESKERLNEDVKDCARKRPSHGHGKIPAMSEVHGRFIKEYGN